MPTTIYDPIKNLSFILIPEPVKEDVCDSSAGATFCLNLSESIKDGVSFYYFHQLSDLLKVKKSSGCEYVSLKSPSVSYFKRLNLF